MPDLNTEITGNIETAVPPAKSIPFHEIPVIDFADFLSGSTKGKQRIAEEIGEALNQVGFFYLINHGIPEDVVQAVFAESRSFFESPPSEKSAVLSDDSSNHRGYFPIGSENVAPTKTRDLKEGFDAVFQGGNAKDYASFGESLRQNQWPESRAEFRSALETYYEMAAKLSGQICRSFALALSMEETAFDKNVKKAASRLRLLSYPGQPSDKVNKKEHGIGEHSDCGCLTVLAQDNVGGLAVRNSQNEWISAPPIPGALIINVGDIMEQWSEGRFSSTVHRVINTSDQTRYSVAMFFNPSLDVVVDGFKSLLTDAEGSPKKTTSEEYMSCCFSEIRSACQLPD